MDNEKTLSIGRLDVEMRGNSQLEKNKRRY